MAARLQHHSKKTSSYNVRILKIDSERLPNEIASCINAILKKKPNGDYLSYDFISHISYYRYSGKWLDFYFMMIRL